MIQKKTSAVSTQQSDSASGKRFLSEKIIGVLLQASWQKISR